MKQSIQGREPYRVVHVGRRGLAVNRYGDPGGAVVLGLHGTPGDRHSAVPAQGVLERLGLSYVTFDRPGYGASTPMRGRRVVDVARDVAAIAEALGFDRFAVVGGSGGAPMALGCSAILPGRVTHVVTVVPPAPVDLIGAHSYFADMDDNTAALLRLALGDGFELQQALTEALGPNIAVGGLVEDLLAIHRPWGFDLSDVGAPVDIWFGTEDTNTPPNHARWLSEHLPNANLHPQAGDHSWPATQLPAIFRSIAIRVGTPASPNTV